MVKSVKLLTHLTRATHLTYLTYLTHLTIILVLLCAASVSGQTASPRPPLIFQPGAGAPRLAPTNQDLFNSLIGSAASIDMDTPVSARVEFDPPTVPLGSKALYRIVLNALDESIKLPDQLPAPNGLQLVAGGRGQAYQPVGGLKLQPQTTIIFHATATSTGVFTMPAFPAAVYGKTMIIPEARLTVTAPRNPAMP